MGREDFSFQKKITTMEKKNENRRHRFFLLLQQFVTSNVINFSRDIKYLFGEHLRQFVDWFKKYFQEDNIDKFMWILDPFAAKLHRIYFKDEYPLLALQLIES